MATGCRMDFLCVCVVMSLSRVNYPASKSCVPSLHASLFTGLKVHLARRQKKKIKKIFACTQQTGIVAQAIYPHTSLFSGPLALSATKTVLVLSLQPKTYLSLRWLQLHRLCRKI